MNVIEVAYLNMNKIDRSAFEFEDYINKFRTLTINNGRQTGTTVNLSELVIKYKFDNVLYVCYGGQIKQLLFKKRIDRYESVYGIAAYRNTVKYSSYNTINNKQYDKNYFDLIIFDDYSRYDHKDLLKDFDYIELLNENGVVLKVG